MESIVDCKEGVVSKHRALVHGAIAVVLLCCVAACSTFSFRTSEIPSSPNEIKREELKLDIVKPERWVLPNGLVVLYRYDDEIPMVGGRMYARAGSLLDPADKVGLASATASQMREGGIATLPPERLNKRLDELAAHVEADADGEYAKYGFSCLTENFDEVFDIFTQMVREPRFDERQFRLWKMLALEGIGRRRDDPSTMAGMIFADAVYGRESVYSQRASVDTITQLTQDDLRAFHRRFVQPAGALLAISGAIPRERIEAAIARKFSDWERRSDALPVYPPVTHEIVPGIYVLERDFNQSNVIIGHLGPERLSRDMFSIAMFNQLFGSGGFDSTLFNEVRSKLGLVYSISGGLFPGPVAGIFEVGLGTRNEEVERSIRTVTALIATAQTTRESKERFDRARSAVQTRFAFNFSETGSILNRAALTEILGFPKDHDYNYLKNLSRVTIDDVRQVAQTRLRPDELVTVVVGRVSAKALANAFRGERDVYRVDFDTVPKILGKVSPD